MPTNTAGSKGYNPQAISTKSIRGRYMTYSDLQDTTDTNYLTVAIIPPNSIIIDGYSMVIEGFNDTNGDDLHIGELIGSTSDPDQYDTSFDMNTADVHTQWNSIADSERYSTSERTITANLETAASDDGTTGKVFVYVEYITILEKSGIVQ